MNRKLFSLLISALAIVVTINCGAHGFLSSNTASSVNRCKCHANSAQVTTNPLPAQSHIGNKQNGPDKNLIRIKAWDNVLTFDIPRAWIFTPIFYHPERATFIGYSSSTLSSCLPLASLRGPPAYTKA